MRSFFAAGALLLGAAAMASMLIIGAAAEFADSPQQLEMDGVVRECAEFPGKEMDMRGSIVFLGPIACNESVVIHVKDALTVQAVDVNVINIHFVVYSTGQLTIKAKKTVKIQRHESSTKPLLDINGGKVKMEAGGWIPDHANSTMEDDGGVVDVKQDGSLSLNSQAKIMYTATSIVVTHKSHKHGEHDGDIFQPVHYEDTEMFAMEERFQAYLRRKSRSHTNDDNADLPPTPPGTTSSNKDPAHDGKDSPSTPDKPSSSSTAPHTETFGSRTHSTLYVPTRNSRWAKRPSTAEPRRSEAFVNRVLLGKLSADDDVSAIWGEYDGAVAFGRRDHAPADGEQVAFARMKTLIAPNDKKVDEVYRARALLRKMQAEDDTMDGYCTDWTLEELQMAEKARRHLKRVDLVLTDRACLTVSLDGICVLERSGRYKREWMNRFPWRRKKSDKYVLRATTDGLEVVHEERKVWGISVGKLD